MNPYIHASCTSTHPAHPCIPTSMHASKHQCTQAYYHLGLSSPGDLSLWLMHVTVKAASHSQQFLMLARKTASQAFVKSLELHRLHRSLCHIFFTRAVTYIKGTMPHAWCICRGLCLEVIHAFVSTGIQRIVMFLGCAWRRHFWKKGCLALWGLYQWPGWSHHCSGLCPGLRGWHQMRLGVLTCFDSGVGSWKTSN